MTAGQIHGADAKHQESWLVERQTLNRESK